MSRQSWVILCIAYILGLLSTGIWASPFEKITLIQGLGLASIEIVLGGIIGAIASRFWRKSPRLPIWIVAGILAGLAIAHFQLRLPQPATNDVSLWQANSREEVTVTGQIRDRPSFNRDQKLRFILAVQKINEDTNIQGKLYATISPPENLELVPRQTITIKGRLYEPQRAKNPGGFDFKAYLAPQGVFAGLSGELLEVSPKQPWGWWKLRQRIVRIHNQGLSEPFGSLVSSMVMGRRAIDLPFEIQDLFIQAGLAHILAASGFHVSLLLGGVLALTRTLEEKYRFAIALVILLAYTGLTGLQPPVLRAVLMGIAVLFAMTIESKVKPLGALLLVATLLLLCNPLWIWNLSFQLSFIATLGLVISVPAITQRLDWLPPTIATIIAIPVAATIWTLPIASCYFSSLATYGILVNIFTTHLGSLIILGGMLSAGIGLIFPWAGTAIASLLFYPTLFLVNIVRFFINLPNSSQAVGNLNIVQVLAIYGIILGICCWKPLQQGKRWLAMAVIAILIAIAPLLYANATLVRMTILAAGQEQIIVIQDRGKVTLIDAGNTDTANYTVLPFLAHEGIDRLDLAVSLKNYRELGWKPIFDKLEVKTFLHAIPTFEAGDEETLAKGVYPFAVGQEATNRNLKIVRLHPAIAQLQFGDRTWLLLYAPNEEILPTDLSAQVLLFMGDSVNEKVLRTFAGDTAIASSSYVSSDTFQGLRQKQIYVYVTGRHGAVQWSPQRGFTTLLNSG
ncbi:ComEC/Rec2 family competence protein [Spirulina sp. 06S082]|uniref:ComEC/Rec2 family competence protein n=1 Tax=Spirulina sp. 06S082 TaxID=3110248 RepID=UPI002B21D54D|nr:ComEC/Rec2 family competence protein [Spirulina sp. 06S082]MEA5467402.1 ComEC/Rec2 family competence protein [Spirulina sp. 06S082]